MRLIAALAVAILLQGCAAGHRATQQDDGRPPAQAGYFGVTIADHGSQWCMFLDSNRRSFVFISERGKMRRKALTNEQAGRFHEFTDRP